MIPNSSPLHRKPRTEIERKIVQVWIDYLGLKSIGIDDNFFELGGDSLLAQQVSIKLNKQLNLKVSVTEIFQYPTIALLSESLNTVKSEMNFHDFSYNDDIKDKSRDIAIIGMAGRFPGAHSIDELWDILRDGKETISFFKLEELDPSIPDSVKNDPNYVKARGILPLAKAFDANFFGLNQKLAEVMDPQIRLFLEIAWEVLEENGYLPEHYSGKIGVYAGTGSNSYYKNNILPNRELMKHVGQVQARTVNEDFIATRTAYHLNLNGPAVTVQSACSTSLLAITEAVDALRNGHCDLALAGASSITAPIHSGHLYEEGSILSSDGHCSPFDSEAKGTLFSDGAGVVLLKNLDLAKKDGDLIHGIIRGIGINNDGGNKGSFSAPNSVGQAGAIAKALFDAKVNPSDISYIEAHGTATPIGDPIEIKGLNMAFGKQEKSGYCALGSLKSNLGHLTAAAGVAGLIKTILSMKHQQIPASLGFNSPNLAIDFENSPFYVNNKLNNWETVGPRIAGVSSFGIGGTNVHIVVEEYNNKDERKPKPSRPLEILSWSAKSQNSLSGYETALADFIKSSSQTDLEDLSYSLNLTRAKFNNRSFIIAENKDEALKKLISKNGSVKTGNLKTVPNEIGFLFPGQGSQFLQMGKTLYENEKVYREAIDTCAKLLMDDLKLDIREIIFPENNSEEAEALLKNTRLTQPALFVTEYALSQLWISWGIKPTLLCGHSIGEFVAAHLSGIFSLEDALHLIATRGRLIGSLPSGSMLSVRLSENELKELLPDSLSIAAINSKNLCVVAGTHKDIEDFAKTMEAKDIPHRLLITSHAFHSSMMDPILADFEEEVGKIKFNTPNIPIVSAATGTWLKESEVTSTSYWVNHLRNTVRFADAIDTILELENPILLEVGPGKALSTLARQQSGGSLSIFPSLVFPEEQNNEYATLLESLGEIWLKGIDPEWKAFYNDRERKLISLPSYVFDRKPCWIEPINFEQYNTLEYLEPVADTNTETQQTNTNQSSIGNGILFKITEIITNITGVTYESESFSKHFLELGLDSLTLTQVSLVLKKEFELPITFRLLNEKLVTLDLLTDYITQNLPKEKSIESHIPLTNNKSHINGKSSLPINGKSSLPKNIETPSNHEVTIGYIAEQLKFLIKQIEALQNQQNSIFSEPLSPNTESLIEIDNKILIKSNDFVETGIRINHSENNGHLKNHTISPKRADSFSIDAPPLPGAKLGRDEKGNPAWYIADSNEEGNYIKIDF